ncbi:hypothetical protein SAMN05428961_11018 [Paenibacillus sp. OK060]|nr:hypothetical protein SAMN05428961_11018 [Paenibacillus sp. OK060]
MTATTIMKTTCNNWNYKNLYKSSSNRMLIFVYCLVLNVKELIA